MLKILAPTEVRTRSDLLISSRRSRTRSIALEGGRRLTNRIEDVEVAEPDEDQEGVEVDGDAEHEEHRGASEKAVESSAGIRRQ